MNTTDKAILEGLKSGDHSVLKEVYIAYRSEFLQFSKRYGLNEADALDIYQDSILTLRENVSTGQLTKLTSSLKTYVFSIGKYMIYDELRRKKKMTLVSVDADVFNVPQNAFEFLFKEELTTNEKLLKQAFEALGAKCKAVLTLFYYQGYSLEEIIEFTDYTSKDVVKSQKSRCLKALKDKMNHGR